MSLKATNFIKNRKEVVAVTFDRIHHILWYTIECYQLLKKGKTIYSKSWVKNNTTSHFEDYLKMELVDKYLIPKKEIISKRISQLEQINFSYETQKRYTDIHDGKEKSDKIDIYINKLGLQNEWNEQDENIYFVIECKRINILSDCKDYIIDVEKFVDRKHIHHRLPFEGQLAFIENNKLEDKKVADEINARLKSSGAIKTIQYLQLLQLHNSFKSSYTSTHKRNFEKKEPFSIFHLLFDYSQIVVN